MPLVKPTHAEIFSGTDVRDRKTHLDSTRHLARVNEFETKELERSRLLLFLFSFVILLLALVTQQELWLPLFFGTSGSSKKDLIFIGKSYPSMNSSLTAANAAGTSGRLVSSDARVPYVEPPPGTNNVADTIRERRQNGQLLELDQVLLNSEPLAAAWNELFGTLRRKTKISGDLRELLILRTAALNGATYEWIQHEPEGLRAGLTLPQLQEIRLTPAFLTSYKYLSASQSAAMLFADWSTKTIKVPKQVYAGLKQYLSNEEMVEAVALVGAYNFLGRFVVALDVGGMVDESVPIPGQ